jgi:hypothetical protein
VCVVSGNTAHPLLSLTSVSVTVSPCFALYSVLPILLPSLLLLPQTLLPYSIPTHALVSIHLAPFFPTPHAQSKHQSVQRTKTLAWKIAGLHHLAYTPVTLHTPTADYARARRVIVVIIIQRRLCTAHLVSQPICNSFSSLCSSTTDRLHAFFTPHSRETPLAAIRPRRLSRHAR